MQWPMLVTAGVWLGVFLLQVVCFVSLLRFTSRERRAFKCLIDEGGWASKNSWVEWVARAFPECDRDEVFGREEALAELEYWLSRPKSLLFLQRLAVLSPLIGVVITAIGLLTLQPEVSQDATLSSILLAVSPLFFGVLGGAILAILSQILLFFVGLGLDSVRQVAREWFDHRVWRPRSVRTRSTIDALSPVLQTLTTTVRESTEAFAANVKDLRDASLAVRKAAAFSQQSFGELGAELKTFSVQMKALETSTSKTIEQMEKASRRFFVAVDTDFAPAALRHHEASQVTAQSAAILGQVLGDLNGSARELARGCAAVQESAEAQREAGDLLSQVIKTTGEQVAQSVKNDFRPANTALRSAVKSFGETTVKLVEVVENGSAPLTSRLREVDQILGQMRTTAASFREFANLKPEVDSLKETLKEMKSIVKEFRNLGMMKEPLKEIQRILERAASSSKAVEELPELFKTKIGELTDQLLHRQMEDLQDVLRDILKQMNYFGQDGRSS
jgi:hypothetical protein